jgi:aminoglycoside/choline kinase family phosphotransferase
MVDEGVPARHGVDMDVATELLKEWGYSFLSGSWVPLAGDGSDRRFFRCFDEDRSYVVLVSPRKKEPVDENDAVWHIGRHLDRVGVPVPTVLHGDPRRGVFVFRDLGSVHLYDLARNRASGTDLLALYRQAVSLLAQCHRKAREGFLSQWCHDGSRYDSGFVYERELLYFQRAFLQGFLGLEHIPKDVDGDFRRLAEKAGEDRGALVFHRDFQSRNLMVCGGSLWIIDFQGMRFGPPEYDLAALLLDPYVMLPVAVRDDLLRFYRHQTEHFLGRGEQPFVTRFGAVALCRCFQCLAAFAFLGGVKGKPGFLEHIAGGWIRLQELLNGPAGSDFPHLRRYVNRLAADTKTTARIRDAHRAGFPPG